MYFIIISSVFNKSRKPSILVVFSGYQSLVQKIIMCIVQDRKRQLLRCFDLLCDLQSSFLQCNTRLKCLSLCQILVKSLNNWYFEVDTWLKLLLINSRRVVPYNNIKFSPLFLIHCLVISLCLNFVHLLA